ncbi:MAG: hypothetical protein LBM04_05835 [Opitutaceae bacterium]|nr:hypothetical protein [Opitutaceae bacterium]
MYDVMASSYEDRQDRAGAETGVCKNGRADGIFIDGFESRANPQSYQRRSIGFMRGRGRADGGALRLG